MLFVFVSLWMGLLSGPRFDSDLVSYAFPGSTDWSSRRGVRTEALVVLKNDRLVFEKYAHGYGPHKKHRTWSISKFFLNILVGAAVHRGILSVEERVAKYLEPPVPEAHEGLLIKHLLAWSSGIDWAETYEVNPFGSSVIAMLYSLGSSDIARYILGRPVHRNHGERYRYSSGDSNLLMHVLRRALPPETYNDFPWTEVFDPLDIRSATFETDPTGLFVASSSLHMTGRELAKLGQLILKKGRWKDREIFTEDWLNFSRQIIPAYRQDPGDRYSRRLSPGYHFWLNRSDLARGITVPLKDVPEDLIAGQGHWGQGLYILPSQNLVIVRFADDRDSSFDLNHFLRLALREFGGSDD